MPGLVAIPALHRFTRRLLVAVDACSLELAHCALLSFALPIFLERCNHLVRDLVIAVDHHLFHRCCYTGLGIAHLPLHCLLLHDLLLLLSLEALHHSLELTKVVRVLPGILHALLEARRHCLLVLRKLALLRSLALLGRRVEMNIKVCNRIVVLHLERLPSGLRRRFVISFGTAAPLQDFLLQVIPSGLSRDFKGFQHANQFNRKMTFNQVQRLLALRYRHCSNGIQPPIHCMSTGEAWEATRQRNRHQLRTASLANHQWLCGRRGR